MIKWGVGVGHAGVKEPGREAMAERRRRRGAMTKREERWLWDRVWEFGGAPEEPELAGGCHAAPKKYL